MTASNFDKAASIDTTIYCGMQASMTFSFFYSDREFPPFWPKNPASQIDISLYNSQDTVKSLKIWNFAWRPFNYENYVCEVPLVDPLSKYFLKIRGQVGGYGSGPDPNVDYVYGIVIGPVESDAFGVIASIPETKIMQQKYVKLNYKHSPVSFK